MALLPQSVKDAIAAKARSAGATTMAKPSGTGSLIGTKLLPKTLGQDDKSLSTAKSETGKIDAQTEKNISEAYARARAGLQARQDVNAQNLSNDLDRQQAQVGGFGGAAVKMRQKAITEAAQGFQADQAGIDSSEAQAKAGLNEARAGRAVGFGQLGMQNEQFNKTMQYTWAELDENKKTNLINAMTALKDAGFFDKKKDELANFFGSGLGGMYENVISRKNIPQGVV